MEDFLRGLKSRTYELSPLDIIPSHLYISNVFFFENASTTFGDGSEFMPDGTLKSAFYDALQRFPILAGRLTRNGLTNTMHIAVDRDDPNLPAWEHSLVKIHFSQVKRRSMHRDAWPEGINITDPLVQNAPKGSESPKLARVHVHRFAGNSGVAIVVRLSHSVFDAKGCTQFINHWASCCRARQGGRSESPDELPPVLDRAVMYGHLPASVRPKPVSWFLWPVSLLLMLLVSAISWFSGKQTTTGSSESHLFRIPRDTLDGLRRTDARDDGQVSDHDIVTALFTMAYAQAKHSGKESSAENIFGMKKRPPAKVSAIVPCDLRHRLGIPESFSGSCAIGVYVTAATSQLLAPISPSSLAAVASISRRAVAELDLAAVEKLTRRAMVAITLLGERARVLYSLMVCQAFSNQSRLPFYETDFGAGKPVLVAPMAYSKSVAVVFPPETASVSSGKGDLCVFLTLEEDDMASLLKNEGFTSIAKLIY